MVELRKEYVVYLLDISPDTGDVTQMKPVAYCDNENYAKEIAKFLSSEDDGGDGSRTYKYADLK